MLWLRSLLVVALTWTTAQPGGLKIVVIAGEDAVNVIQQRTAVSPIVEVRDRNNQPVSGALVTFTIQGGKNAAFTGGSQTLTVTTNAAGRAAASTLSPLSSGGVQIQVQAAFQGQTVAATIAQTNVMTAAEATNVAAAAGGGGVSGLAIAGVAGGVGAGALVALKALGGSDAPTDSTGPGRPTASAEAIAASGTYTLQQINGSGLPALTVDSPPNPCPGFTDNGTLTLSTSPELLFDMTESSHIECPIGTANTFRSTNSGSWTISGGTITFVLGGGQFNPGQASLRDSILSFAFDAPHANTGNPAKRVNSSWRK